MARDIIYRQYYDPGFDPDPKVLPPTDKKWLNDRTDFVKHRINVLRQRGLKIPKTNCEFVIGCAAPFRYASSMNAEETDNVIREMVRLYIRLGHFKEEPEAPLALAG